MDRQGGEERAERDRGPGEGFRVVDRRRFRGDGEPVEGAAAGREDDARSTPQPPPDAGQARPQAGPAEPARQREPGPSERPDRQPLPPPTFATLVSTLALNVVAALGIEPGQGEEGSVSRPDLPLARHTIDLLGMLAQKTAGNLSPDEARLLEQTLFDLRMLFVRVSSRPG